MRALGVLLILLLTCRVGLSADKPLTMEIWPGKAPDEKKEFGPEYDTTKEKDRLIANKPVQRITNVTRPTITVYHPAKDKDTNTAVVVCPGGGHRILALDLEGTEVAEWLNSVGVTAIVLKYRVPARDENRRWLSAVQDAQRAMSLVRSKAETWNIEPRRIGILGFSAGGETAALTSLFQERLYAPIDDVDKVAYRPDFAVLIYPGGLVEKGDNALRDYVKVTEKAPPMFFVHAFDDGVSVQNSLLLASALKKNKVPAELHIYAYGGHGFGLRASTQPCTQWPRRCEEWMNSLGMLKSITNRK